MESADARLARRWFEQAWNEKRQSAVDELVAEGCVAHLEGREAHGRSELRVAWGAFLEAFPDLHVTVEDTLAEGGKVAVRWQARATHRGASLGIPPTGTEACFRGITWLEIEAGKVSRAWDAWNLGGLLHCLQQGGGAS